MQLGQIHWDFNPHHGRWKVTRVQDKPRDMVFRDRLQRLLADPGRSCYTNLYDLTQELLNNPSFGQVEVAPVMDRPEVVIKV